MTSVWLPVDRQRALTECGHGRILRHAVAKKLGIKADHTVALIDEPRTLRSALAPLASNVSLVTNAKTSRDVVVAFFTDRAEFEHQLPSLAKAIYPAGGLWIAWPKKAQQGTNVPT